MTNGEAQEAMLRSVHELYAQIEKHKNTIFVNRGHITFAKRKIAVLERGVKLFAKGHIAKAVRIFEHELQNNFSHEQSNT